MITADQILLHLIGDYLTQSDWMANEKTKRFVPAAAHALVYSLGFLVFRPSVTAWLVICLSHFAIDRYRLARYVVWVKNLMAPRDYVHPWWHCTRTGYPKGHPDWLAVWLMLIADNVIHLAINGAALKYL